VRPSRCRASASRRSGRGGSRGREVLRREVAPFVKDRPARTATSTGSGGWPGDSSRAGGKGPARVGLALLDQAPEPQDLHLLGGPPARAPVKRRRRGSCGSQRPTSGTSQRRNSRGRSGTSEPGFRVTGPAAKAARAERMSPRRTVPSAGGRGSPGRIPCVRPGFDSSSARASSSRGSEARPRRHAAARSRGQVPRSKTPAISQGRGVGQPEKGDERSLSGILELLDRRPAPGAHGDPRARRVERRRRRAKPPGPW